MRSETPSERHDVAAADAPKWRRGRRFGAVAVVCIASAAMAVAAAGWCRAARRPPNVLVVVLDTARADRCGFLGYGRPTTPHLDAFARDAVVFSEAWSPASWTLPAHASMFTGQHPDRHGIRNGGSGALAPSVETLAERLASAGYATACFSNNPHVAAEFGLTQGFATVHELFRKSGRELPWARETHDLAAAWIEARVAERRPFFAFVNDMEPHAPQSVTEELRARWVRPGLPPDVVDRAAKMTFPRSLAVSVGAEPIEADELAALSDLYDAEMATLDAEIGTLLARLASLGVLDDTLVVFVSDHGEGLGDHGWIEHAVRLDRELLRVPLVVRLPGRFEGGWTDSDVARIEDLFPTILTACRVPLPAELDGVALDGDREGRVAWATERGYGRFADMAARFKPNLDVAWLRRERRSIFDGRHHLIVDGDVASALFDTAADPGERTDLSAREPEIVGRLRERLDAEVRAVRDAPR